MIGSRHLSDWLDDLVAGGRYHFETAEALEALGVVATAFHKSVARLKKAGRVASPSRGFYLVVPPEYRALGCLPAEQFIDPLMRSLGTEYYVCLLSAAAYYGAGHQRPQRFQVMVPKPRRPVRCGGVRVDFFVRGDATATPVHIRNTRTGFLRVASPEATALELVGYSARSGGLQHVATVLSELGEKLELGPLVAAAEQSPVAWTQRLGWLLELTDHADAASALAPFVKSRVNAVSRLLPGAPTRGAVRDERWRLLVNAELELDEL